MGGPGLAFEQTTSRRQVKGGRNALLGLSLTNPDFLWSLVGSLHFMRLSLKERRTRSPVQSCVQEIGAIDGCPILRVLCEGWDSQVSPPDLPRKADLFLRRPGFLLAKGSRPEHPGLKSETWATHSMFVRAIFIFLEWTAGPSILLFGTVRRAAARRPFRAAQSAAPG